MWDEVVSKTNLLGERRPSYVVGRREEFHRAIPPTFDFTIALGVVATSGGARCARSCQDVRKKFRHEFLCFVTVQNIRCGATAEKDFVEKAGGER